MLWVLAAVVVVCVVLLVVVVLVCFVVLVVCILDLPLALTVYFCVVQQYQDLILFYHRRSAFGFEIRYVS